MTPIILNDLMYDRGRGPELRRTRITVYDLVPYLLKENYSDALMFEAWPSITLDELQTLKKYFRENRQTVMAKHWEFESKMIQEWAAQCTPENLAQWHETRLRTEAFKTWIEEQKKQGTLPPASERLAAFNAHWDAKRESLVGSEP